MIEISTYTPSLNSAAAAAYNELTAFTPYCYPLTPEIFMEAIAGRQEFDPSGFFLAWRNGKPAGLLHAGFKDANARKQRTGSIFLFLANEREASQELYGRAVAYLKRGGAGSIEAVSAHVSGSNDFYSGVYMGLEVCLWGGMPEVMNTFRRNGLEPSLLGFIMSLRLPAEPAVERPGSGAEIRVERQTGRGSLILSGTAAAFEDGEPIGTCGFHYFPRLSEHLGKGIGQITISVREGYRRKNVGSALLTTAHRELFALGARKVILATNYSLYPALCLYQKLGYAKELIGLSFHGGRIDA